MTIDRQFNRIVIECESCDELIVGDAAETFEAVWATAKREGWRAKKIGENWIHECARCGVPT
jgi:hypothetical protein